MRAVGNMDDSGWRWEEDLDPVAYVTSANLKRRHLTGALGHGLHALGAQGEAIEHRGFETLRTGGGDILRVGGDQLRGVALDGLRDGEERGGLKPSGPRFEAAPRQVTLLQRKRAKVGGDLGKSTGWIHRRALKERGVVMIPGSG
jgi:2,4-dienoyl-CoA reductase (NADPH2)